MLEITIQPADSDSFRVDWRWNNTGIRLNSVLDGISLGQAILPFSIRTLSLTPKVSKEVIRFWVP